jgi:hypothetical protein
MAINIKRTASAVKQMVKADQAILKKLGPVNIKSLESMPAPRGLVAAEDLVLDSAPALKTPASFQQFQAQKNFEPMTFGQAVEAKAVSKAPAGQLPAYDDRYRQSEWMPSANKFQKEMADIDAAAAAPKKGLWDRFVDGRGPQKVGGALITAGLVNQMCSNRGQQSNAQLYGQE